MASHRLRVLSLNCLFLGKARARLQAIAKGLYEIGADVVCLQEVFWRPYVSLLASQSPTYEPGGLGVKGGLVTLTAAAVESRTFAVFETGVWFEWLARKGFLISQLRHEGEALTVVNTHLMANYSEDWAAGNGYARRQVAELEQLAAALRQVPDDRLLVVAGDFNVPASSPIFASFLAASGLRSAVEWEQFPNSRGALAIDNVLYRQEAGRPVTAAARLRFEDPVRLADGRITFASDHVGVEADFEW